jgi:hypothetical protein
MRQIRSRLGSWQSYGAELSDPSFSEDTHFQSQILGLNFPNIIFWTPVFGGTRAGIQPGINASSWLVGLLWGSVGTAAGVFAGIVVLAVMYMIYLRQQSRKSQKSEGQDA